ncbi:MAG TPA: MFS transporter, partial [Candidatus Bathyarchaeia archaeon]|nr:MFS transporter [Candidatus Bathyarchaeia archaeon]
GLGSAFFRVSNTLVAESTGYRKRGTAFGTYQALSSVAAASSPLIGGFTITRTGFFPLFIIAGVLTLIAAIARLALLKETLPKDQRISSSGIEKNVISFFEGFKTVLSKRAILSLVFIYSMYNLLVDQNSPIAPLYAKVALRINNFGIGELFCVVLCIVAISKYAFGRVTDRIGRKRTILLSWMGEVGFVYVFVFAPQGNIQIALIGIALWMLFGVMDGPAINAWVAELVPTSKTRGYSMGVFYTTTILPTVPALVLSGYLFTIRPQLPFFANSIMGIMCIILLVGLKDLQHSSAEQPTLKRAA